MATKWGVRGFSAAAALGVVLSVLLGSAAAAQEAAPPEAAAGAPTDHAGPRIDTTAAPATDRAIERRLRGIFSELDGLGDVRIAVRDGVVQLSGETLSVDLRERAVRLARQVQGVAEVEDHIEEVRDVQRRIASVSGRLIQRGWDLIVALPLLVVAVLIVAAFWLLGWIVGRWEAPFRRLSHNRFLADLLQQVMRVAIVLAGVVVALEVLDASALVSTVLGAAGILGLALGFALRDTVENYIASLLLSLRQPFGHDDLVVIEGWEGRVLRLTSRATVLMTLDGNHVRVPNAVVYKSVIVNYTRNPARAFKFDLGIDPAEDLAAVQQLGADTLLGMDGVLDDPPPVASVEAIGDSTVTVRILGWVDQRHADFLKVRSEAIRLVKQAYDAAGISLPEPRYGVTFIKGVTETAAHAGGEGRGPVAPRGPTDAIDIAPRDDLDRHIRGERRGHAEDDLLTSGAPRE